MLSYPRIAGFLYLLLAITGYYAYYATESLLVVGDIDSTADNITASYRFLAQALSVIY